MGVILGWWEEVGAAGTLSFTLRPCVFGLRAEVTTENAMWGTECYVGDRDIDLPSGERLRLSALLRPPFLHRRAQAPAPLGKNRKCTHGAQHLGGGC